MVDRELQTGELEHRPVRQLPDVVGLAELQPPEHLPCRAREPLGRIRQQFAIVGVDPGGDVTGAAHGHDGPHMVDVTVGQQHRDGLQPMLAQEVVDALDGVLTWIDDHALLARSGSDDVAVGLERPCGKPGDEHGSGLCVS